MTVKPDAQWQWEQGNMNEQLNPAKTITVKALQASLCTFELCYINWLASHLKKPVEKIFISSQADGVVWDQTSVWYIRRDTRKQEVLVQTNDEVIAFPVHFY